MAEKEYIISVERVARAPRSQRRRLYGGSGSASVGTAAGGTGAGTGGGTAGSGGSPDGHTHANLADLAKISTDNEGYLYLTFVHETVDAETGETDAEEVTWKVKGGFADKAGTAHTLDEDSPVRKEFLSRVADDIAEGNITFMQAVEALGKAMLGGGAEFGEFIGSLYAGKGAAIDGNGNAEVESLKVRSFLEVLQLIVNRLTAIEGDQVLTEGDTIETVDDLGGGRYGLHLKRKWEGYFTAQVANNVLRGIYNTLAEGSGTYYTNWMRVNSVNTAGNYIEVTMYPDDEVPGGKNFAPIGLMNFARWGNQTDPQRQSCLYLSSTEGRIVKLTGVTKPILDASNYGATFGTLPDFLKDMGLPLAEGQDYLYARGIVVEDLIQVDYLGRPVATIVDRGPWQAGADYYAGDLNERTGKYEISDVWYQGCKWRCARTGSTTAPAWNNTDWAMVEGNPDFEVYFEETEGLFDPDTFATTLSVKGRLYNQDVTADILDADVQWTRYSEDAEGNPRVADDTAWALRRAGAGKVLALDREDCGFNGYVPKVLRFTATVTLADGMSGAAAFEFG